MILPKYLYSPKNEELVMFFTNFNVGRKFEKILIPHGHVIGLQNWPKDYNWHILMEHWEKINVKKTISTMQKYYSQQLVIIDRLYIELIGDINFKIHGRYISQARPGYKDNTPTLAHAIHEMIDRIKSIIGTLNYLAEELEKGDYTHDPQDREPLTENMRFPQDREPLIEKVYELLHEISGLDRDASHIASDITDTFSAVKKSITDYVKAEKILIEIETELEKL